MWLSNMMNAVLLSTFDKNVFSVVLLSKAWGQKNVFKDSKKRF
jgi:hypothetical protein